MNEHETRLTEWRTAGGWKIGPPPLPPCPYCRSYLYGCPIGGCRCV